MDKSPVIENLEHTSNANLYNSRIKINLRNIEVSLGNAFRRIMISELPSVAFNEKDINIICNTGVLHNQFLEHRLSLTPITIYDSKTLLIYSSWNNDTGKRENTFASPSGIPKFKIEINNDKVTRELYTKERPYDLESETLINLTSKDIKFIESMSFDDDIEKYIKPDLLVTDIRSRQEYNKVLSPGYVLLNKLKINSDGIGESIHLTLEPSVGTGKEKTIYSPVGTVAFSNIQETPDKLDAVFNYKLDSLNTERISKDLLPISSEEKKVLRKEFDTLDAKRVFLTNDQGEPNAFTYTIESIGSLTPSQIFKNSILYLYYKLLDINNSISFDTDGVVLNTNKIEIITNQVIMDSIDIKLHYEEHTVGNLLNKYMQNYFTTDNSISNKIFNFVSYQQNHPLDKFIIIRLNYDPNISLVKIRDYLKDKSHIDNDLHKILNQQNNFNDNTENLGKVISMFLIKQVIYVILRILKKIELEFQTKIGIHYFNGLENSDYIRYNEDSLNSDLENIIKTSSNFITEMKTHHFEKD